MRDVHSGSAPPTTNRQPRTRQTHRDAPEMQAEDSTLASRNGQRAGPFKCWACQVLEPGVSFDGQCRRLGQKTGSLLPSGPPRTSSPRPLLPGSFPFLPHSDPQWPHPKWPSAHLNLQARSTPSAPARGPRAPQTSQPHSQQAQNWLPTVPHQAGYPQVSPMLFLSSGHTPWHHLNSFPSSCTPGLAPSVHSPIISTVDTPRIQPPLPTLTQPSSCSPGSLPQPPAAALPLFSTFSTESQSEAATHTSILITPPLKPSRGSPSPSG